MAERERFIPKRIDELTAELVDRPWPDGADLPDQFTAFSRLTSALYHYEFHGREHLITEAWDRIIDDPEAADIVTSALTGLLDGANYTPVTMAELNDALTNESLIPLRLEVDLDDYDELFIYRRGTHQQTVEVPRWMGLRSIQRTITVDDRVVVYSRVKPQQWFDEHGIDPAERNLVANHVSLKQFQNVPRADIEMLLPSTQVGFRLVDSLLLGVPAIASGIAVLATKLLPTLGLVFLLLGAWLGLRDEQPDIDQSALVILLGGAVTVGAFVFRQWSKLKSRRLDYLKTLTESLYFRTLGAGTGVIHTLLASAEQQEVAEALIAYRFLLDAPDGLTPSALDSAVERWLRDSGHGDIDFEVADAIAKLARLDAIDQTNLLRARPLAATLAQLDRRWDDLFVHHVHDPGATTESVGSTPLIRLRQVIDRFRGRIGERLTEREPDDDER